MSFSQWSCQLRFKGTFLFFFWGGGGEEVGDDVDLAREEISVEKVYT